MVQAPKGIERPLLHSTYGSLPGRKSFEDVGEARHLSGHVGVARHLSGHVGVARHLSGQAAAGG